MQAKHFSTLMSVEGLSVGIKSDNLCVIDCRFDLMDTE